VDLDSHSAYRNRDSLYLSEGYNKCEDSVNDGNGVISSGVIEFAPLAISSVCSRLYRQNSPAMDFSETLCLVRGGGDLATGVIHRLHLAGFPLMVTELEQPRVVRRMASVAEAVYSGEIRIGSLLARRMSLDEAKRGGWTTARPAADSAVAVIADPDGELLRVLRPAVLIDARMAKRALDTDCSQAPLVIALGPGFEAGRDCHAIVETKRGHDLGRVLWSGAAERNTGEPEAVLGHGTERVLRAPCEGVLHAVRDIGDRVAPDELLASVGDIPVRAPFAGVLRGLLHDGLRVQRGEKIGDVDPRGDARYCFSVSDKALAVGGGVLEAVLTWLTRN